MVILICIFPMISDVEHLLLHLLVIFISSLEKCLFEPFACFFFFFNCFSHIALLFCLQWLGLELWINPILQRGKKSQVS